MDADLSFMSAMRSGMSNDGMMMQYNDGLTKDIIILDVDENNSGDSILNSHRRSKSQSK